MSQETRPGAQGLPNTSRESNKKRYALGRVTYYLREAEKAVRIAAVLVQGDELTALDALGVPEMAKAAQALEKERPLQTGDMGRVLGVAGKKAKAAKAAEGEGE